MSETIIKDLLAVDMLSQESLFTPGTPVTKQAHADISKLLLAGDRIGAAHTAMKLKLWGHALIIAAYANKDVYNEVITAYSSQHIGSGDPVRTLFDLFGGKVTAPDLFDPHQPAMAQRWQQNLQMILANRTPGDMVALMRLGMYLLDQQLVGPAHLW